MAFYYQLAILFSTILVACCSSKPTATESEKNLPQNISTNSKSTDIAPTNPPVLEFKLEKSKSSQKDVLYYFYEVYPKRSGKPVDGLNFEEEDLKNGYLKVTGNMEGYFVFALFKGDQSDWVIEQSTSCGPECEQSFHVYKFENGKLSSKEKFESLFPKKKLDAHVANLIKKLPRGHTDEELQRWIKLPQSGTTIDILILEQNPGHTSGKVLVYHAGKLEWNGSGFNFVPLNPIKPSPIDISNVR